MLDGTVSAPGTRRVLILDADEERSRRVAAALAEDGYATATSTDGVAADAVVASSASAAGLLRSWYSGSGAADLSGCPMLVLVDEARDPGTDRPVDALVVQADDAPEVLYLPGPIDPRTVVSHVDSLLTRHLHQSAKAEREARRRSTLRSALSVVRGGTSAEEIAELLLELVPPVFDAGRAAVLTLPDERVPALSLSVGGPSPLAGSAAEASVLRQLAETLWQEHSALDLDSRQARDARLAVLPRRGLLVPIGAVEAGFGLLWLDRGAVPRWSRAEIEAAQQVAREVGHLLVIAQLSSSRRALQRRVRAAEQAHATMLLKLDDDLRDPLTALLARLDSLHGPAAPTSPAMPLTSVTRPGSTAASRWAEPLPRPSGQRGPSAGRGESAADALTAREREMVSLVGLGLTNHDIAGRLHLSPLTVKTHINRAMTKLQLSDRAQLVVFAYRSGLADAG